MCLQSDKTIAKEYKADTDESNTTNTTHPYPHVTHTHTHTHSSLCTRSNAINILINLFFLTYFKNQDGGRFLVGTFTDIAISSAYRILDRLAFGKNSIVVNIYQTRKTPH